MTEIVSPANRSSWLDALKGWAVLGVIATHAEMLTAPGRGFVQGLASSGRYGVQLFFVLSAMTVMVSWQRRNDGMAPFYIRRILRIVPLFWLAILFYGFLVGPCRPLWAADDFSATDLVLTASFLNALSPDSLNVIVPGGWSITSEMMFYVALPFVASRIPSLRSALTVLLIAAVASIILNTLAYAIVEKFRGDFVAANFQFFWIGNQVTVFAAGIVAWQMRQTIAMTPSKWKLVTSGAVATLFLLSTIAQNLNTIYGVAFALIATAAAKGGAKWLENPLVTSLGKRSYSAYLWHYIVMVTLASPRLWTSGWTTLPLFHGAGHALARMCFLIGGTATATLVLSMITYKFIESPCIKLGETLASQFAALRKHHSPTPGCCARASAT